LLLVDPPATIQKEEQRTMVEAESLKESIESLRARIIAIRDSL